MRLLAGAVDLKWGFSELALTFTLMFALMILAPPKRFSISAYHCGL
jgi:hypothetical protein